MSWKLIENYRRILADEAYASGFSPAPKPAANMRVAVVYPNTYPIAIAELGSHPPPSPMPGRWRRHDHQLRAGCPFL